MSYDEILLETYTENIRELEDERAGLTYYEGFDGSIVEKYVTCKRPNCICHRGYLHGPNKYFRHREDGRWKELYLGMETDSVWLSPMYTQEETFRLVRFLENMMSLSNTEGEEKQNEDADVPTTKVSA